jgi:hypothetical protein
VSIDLNEVNKLFNLNAKQNREKGSVYVAKRKLGRENDMGTYHSTNTAEAAFILWRNSGLRLGTGIDQVSLKELQYDETEGKVIIILEETEPGHIGQAIQDWPGSPEFHLYGIQHWLNLGIKNLKEINQCPQYVKTSLNER